MSKPNNYLFIGLTILAWIIFVGLSVEAGGLLVNFFFSLYKPEFVQNLYQKLDLSEMYNKSQYSFFIMYTFILTIAILKAYLFYIVVMLITKLDLAKPFNQFVAKQITRISFITLAIGLLSTIAENSATYLSQLGYQTEQLQQFWGDSEAFILMAAVIYIIATIFAKGVELQNENDLTV